MMMGKNLNISNELKKKIFPINMFDNKRAHLQ